MKILSFALLALTTTAFSQKQELAFTLGTTTNDLATALNARASSGTALQANYGYRVIGSNTVAVSAELHFLANPLRQVTGGSTLTRDFASLYLTPGVRAKLNPQGRIQPFGSIGGGYALYEQSTTTIAGAANSAPRLVHRGAFMVGGGVDVRVLRWLALRGDVRDFYTGRPVLSLANQSGRQHNIVASGGFVLRFGK